MTEKRNNDRYSNQLLASYYSPQRKLKLSDRPTYFCGLRKARKEQWRLAKEGFGPWQLKSWKQLRAVPIVD